MYHLNIKESNHNWVKKNLVTIGKSGRHYDLVECSNCGIKGKRYNLATVEVSGNYKAEKAYECTNPEEIKKPKKIRIIHCSAVNPAFVNVTPNSVHEVISAPAKYGEDKKGVWIMGNGEPVKVLNGEFVEVV